MTSPELHEILKQSEALEQYGRDQENAALLIDAIRRFPDDVELCVRTSLALLPTSPQECKRLLQRATDLAPDDPKTFTRCASQMFYLAEYDTAREYVRSAGRLAPNDFPLRAELLHLMGRLAAEKGDDSLAEQALVAAFDEAPAGAGHGRVLAEFYARRSRVPEALEVADEAVLHLPDDENLHATRERIAEQLTHDPGV